MPAMPRLSAALAAVSIFVSAAPLMADGGPPLKTRLQRDFMPAKFADEQQEIMGLMKDLAKDEASKGAFYPLFQWPPAIKKLKVCFFGGSTEVRQAIRDLASEWEGPDNSVKFDWGKNDFRDCEKATQQRLIHIRVGFTEPGYFSALGSTSGFRDNTNELSMNFQGFDKMTAAQIKDGWFGGTVRHEFGHAIGLIHEHQSPKSSCEDDFDWDTIYKEAAGPPNEWDKEKVDSNMRRILDPDMFSTKFDPKSVMKYYYDPKMFKNGTESACYTEGDNNTISELDRKTVAFMYPPSEQARLEKFKQDRAAFAALVEKAEEEGASKSIGPDLLAKYFPESLPEESEE
jgi:Astacin (Peptidase family M12A)